MIYIASPLFNTKEQAFNRELADKMRTIDDVFLPQRDGYLLVDMLDAGVPLPVAQRRIFKQDLEAMTRSRVIVAVLDGAHVDEGVAFEIGFASALGRRCIGYQSDVRRALPSGNNPMIQCSLSVITRDVNDLLQQVRLAVDTDILPKKEATGITC